MAIVREGLLAARPRQRAVWPWWLGGAVLFGAVAMAAAQNATPLALGVLVLALGGLVVLFRPELGVIALTATFFLGYLSALEGTGRFTINNLLGVVLAGLLVAKAVGEREAAFLRSRHVWLFALLGVVVVINQFLTTGLTPPPELGALDLSETRVQSIVTKIAYLVFVVAFIRTRSQLVLLAGMIVLFVLLTAPNALANALSASAANVERIRAAADFGIRAARNANRLAFVCAIAIALIGFAMRQYRSRLLWAGGLASIALLVATVFFSASRSGFLNLIVLAGVFLYRAGARTRTLVTLTVLGAVLFLAAALAGPQSPDEALLDPAGTIRYGIVAAGSLVVPQKYLDRITNLGTDRGEEGAGSTHARLGLLQTGVRMFADHPLTGVGIGNFRWLAIDRYGLDRISALHNSYVLTLVEGGLLLFVTYLLIYGHAWRSLVRTRRQAGERPEVGLGWLVDAVHAILLMFLVFSVFADLWHDIYPFLIVALAAVLAQLYAPRPERRLA